MGNVRITLSEERMSIEAIRYAQQLLVTGLTMAGYSVKSSEGSESGSYSGKGEWGESIPYKHVIVSIIAEMN